jgi:lysophospholipase L1-like esterase
MSGARRWAVGAVACVVLSALGLVSVPARASTPAWVRPGRTVNVMMLGDSITVGQAGAFARVAGDLSAMNARFVGSQGSEPARHEGHGGWCINPSGAACIFPGNAFTGGSLFAGVSDWLPAHQPDVVVVLAGINDRFTLGLSDQQTADRVGQLVDRVAVLRPDALVLVSKLATGADRMGIGVNTAFNAALDAMVATRQASGRSIASFDAYGPLTAADFPSGVPGIYDSHPLASGYQKMGTHLVDTLRPYLASSGTVATTTTAPGTNPPSGGTAPSSSCRTSASYVLLGASGRTWAFGTAGSLSSTIPILPGAVDITTTPNRDGGWVVDRRGTAAAFGAAPAIGPAPALGVGESIVSVSSTATGRGAWLFSDLGRVFPLGDARSHGDLSGTRLNAPILDSVASPSGDGYWMVAADGGVFAFDVPFVGSMGGQRLNAPVRSLVPTCDGRGYWLVASDGGVFAFGAPFVGSMGGRPLNRPIRAMVASGAGYLLVGEDGGVFAFGTPFAGSLGERPPDDVIVSLAVS